MNRHIIINSAIAVAIVGLVAAVFVIEDRNSNSAPPHTIPVTTSTIPATTTSSMSTSTTTSTTSTTSTTTSTTSTTVAPTSTEVPLPRGVWKVIVVNGSPSGERLQPMIDRLRELGYNELRGLVGAVQTPTTGIYYSLPGMENAAERLRADLELDVEIALFDDAPPVAGRNDAQLMLYLGGS